MVLKSTDMSPAVTLATRSLYVFSSASVFCAEAEIVHERKISRSTALICFIRIGPPCYFRRLGFGLALVALALLASVFVLPASGSDLGVSGFVSLTSLFSFRSSAKRMGETTGR